jgi:hypothetical protein
VVEGYPAYAAGDDRHLYWYSKSGSWYLTNAPFDPVASVKPRCAAAIVVPGGPVPTGKRAWQVALGGEWVDGELTAREVA